ncbi:MAG: formylglycine-generating enzyme family protein [Rhodoferax sp.]|nr:formylglycine-generating enzyme family protein [Rhodoferax sp.]
MTLRHSGRRIAGVLTAALAIAAAAWWAWDASGRKVALQAGAETLRCDVAGDSTGTRHPGMVWVPGGSFDLGDTLYPEEQPLRKTTVKGFWMDRTEVTNDAFAEFVQTTGYLTVAQRPVDPRLHPGLPSDMQQPGAVVFVMPNAIQGQGNLTQWWRYIPGANWRHPGGPLTSIAGRGSFPVVTVTIEDALAYAKWKGRSLPSEAQWEWAARAAQDLSAGTNDQPKAANTWQGLFPVANSGEDGFVGLAPVGCYTANALGLFDLIGNVWELTADRWMPSHAAADSIPSDPASSVLRQSGAAGQYVIKGGSFLCAPSYCMRYRAGSRQPQDADLGASHLGFRTVLEANGP